MYKSQRNFDMSSFGWTDCKFSFNALTWGEMKKMDKARKDWQRPDLTEEETEKAANQIIDLMKSKYIKGEALDDENKKVDVKVEDFENIPFDIFLKLMGWLISGEVDEGFLVK